MGLVLCPRCELNYMSDKDTYCSVCMKEVRGIAPRDEVELCSICNVNPVLPGKDVCAACIKELVNTGKDTSTEDGNDQDGESADLSSMDAVTSMDEIMPMDDDDDNQNYGDMEHALSLESVREDEENSMDEDMEPDET